EVTNAREVAAAVGLERGPFAGEGGLRARQPQGADGSARAAGRGEGERGGVRPGAGADQPDGAVAQRRRRGADLFGGEARALRRPQAGAGAVAVAGRGGENQGSDRHGHVNTRAGAVAAWG